MAKYVEGIYASCALCRQWVGRGIAMDTFNVVCMDCADAITKCVKVDSDADSAEAESEFVCSKCGEVFTNRGKYLAHCKTHKKEESESDS